MSTSVYWRPVAQRDNSLGSDLKWALRRHLNDGHDSGPFDRTEADELMIPWLRGVADGGGQGSKEAEDLIEIIQKHGTVEIWESS